jgi:hypothetical protein
MRFFVAIVFDVLALGVLTMACGPRPISADSRDGIVHAINLDRMTLRYIDASSDPGLLLVGSACSLRGVLAREGAPLPPEDGGALAGCPQ